MYQREHKLRKRLERRVKRFVDNETVRNTILNK